MRWRWSGELPTIERSAEVPLPADVVYAEFRGSDDLETSAIALVSEDPPHALVWTLDLRGLRDARLRIGLEPVATGVTRVTTTLDARLVGRLRLRRASLVRDYTAVLTAILDRACERMAAPGPDEAGDAPADEDPPVGMGPLPAPAG